MDRTRLTVDQSIIVHVKPSRSLDVIYGKGVLLSDTCCRAPSANRVKNAQAADFVFHLKHAHAQSGLIYKMQI